MTLRSALIKFFDDIAVICFIIEDDESNYRNEIDLLVKWCKNNNLILNIDRTKELIVDFIKRRNTKDSIVINGSSTGKYLEISWSNCESYSILDSKC